MSSNIVQRSFNGTCVPIEYRCAVNDRYIDPCTCSAFYLCEREDKIIPQLCPDGTGFDHEKETCDDLTKIVLDGLCDQEKPWERCLEIDDYDDVDERELIRRCTNIMGETPPPESDDEGVDGGLIAGVIIAVLVILVIVVVLIVYIRKKGNPIQNLKETQLWRNMTHKDTGGQGTTQPSASRHGSGHGDEETYAEIDDTALYKDPSGGKPLAQSLSHTNETYDRDMEEGVAYDNPALKRDTPPLPDADPPEYSPLEEREQAIRSYSSLNEHRAATTTGRNSNEPITGDDGYLVAEAIGESRRSEGPEDPNYFMLEKS